MRTVVTLSDVVKIKNEVGVAPDTAPAPAQAEEIPDSSHYYEQVVGLIPAESVAMYVGLNALMESASELPPTAPWVVFILALLSVPFFVGFGWLRDRRKDKKAKHLPFPGLKMLVQSLALVVWVFAIGGPFTLLEGYHPFWGAVALAGFSPIAPKVLQALEWIQTPR